MREKWTAWVATAVHARLDTRGGAEQARAHTRRLSCREWPRGRACGVRETHGWPSGMVRKTTFRRPSRMRPPQSLAKRLASSRHRSSRKPVSLRLWTEGDHP